MTLLVQEYISASAKLYPDKCAVSCEAEKITYRQLDDFTNALARQLRVDGIERGTFIPFFMKKNVNCMKALISILKADCPYIPLDINSPATRLQSILDNAVASTIIVDSYSSVLFDELMPDHDYRLLDISTFVPKDVSPLNYENLSIDLAYVLFTSGSTGIPKGVMISHQAIVDYIDWCVDTYGITAEDEVANHAPLYFDNSTFDIYTAFKSGATLHLVHDEVNAIIPRLITWLGERRISVFFCVPSVLTLLLRTRRLKENSFPALRHVICAGEALRADIVLAWMEKYPHVAFTNMYGPTEITVDCSYYCICSKEEITGGVPIGKARRNMELFVRRDDGNLSKLPGSEGELLVRGTSVASGYLGNQQKTREVFIQNPLNPHFHDMLYCTGDQVRINAEGDFLFLGRADDQIKFLGYRIELGEIETALTPIPGVEEGLVVFNNAEDEQLREIGALVRLVEGFSKEELIALLKVSLPGYMVPTRVLVFDKEFPRTANGKYDRKKAVALVFGS